MSKLAVIVLGNRDSGKSYTWNSLFNRKVRSGYKWLNIFDEHCIELFLISGSPQERGKTIEEILKGDKPDILLSSIQYCFESFNSFDYLINSDYKIYCYWLNPGYEDKCDLKFDNHGVINFLLSKNATITITDANSLVQPRIEEIKRVILSWALSKGMIKL